MVFTGTKNVKEKPCGFYKAENLPSKPLLDCQYKSAARLVEDTTGDFDEEVIKDAREARGNLFGYSGHRKSVTVSS